MGVIAHLVQYDIRFLIYPRESHNLPHCHVTHKGKKAVMDLENISFIRGRLDPRAERRALNYVRNNQEKFLNAWHTMRAGKHPEAFD